MKKSICVLLAFFFCLTVPTSAESPDSVSVQVPIIMYHSLAGNGGDTCISAAGFEADLKYLKEQGYETVFLSDLAAFVHDGGVLPEKPVVLTFDDGYYNNYSKALPLAIEYDVRIVVSVIGSDVERWSKDIYTDERDGHVSWTQVREMVESGHVEIGNHTWDLHRNRNGRKGCTIKSGESIEHYAELLTEDLEKLQESLSENCGVTPVGFTYPFGYMCPEATELLKEMGFQVTLSAYGGKNTINRGDAESLYALYRYNRSSKQSVETILTKLVK